ncbi:hypothetical protein HKK80_01185 [Halonotius sp. F2-221B]|uniref:hypothetical protein n=1 Tax=Halonotius sp. F2-221B TaxID=2731620 RepID=UPI00398B6AC1
MKSKRSIARQCKNLAKEHVENQDEPAAPTGDSGHTKWAQIAIILFRVEIDKSLRETEAYLNTMSPVPEDLNLERSL